MRIRRSWLSLALAAALLAGQWLAAAHGADHALQPDAAHVCAVCVYADGAGTPSAVPHVAVIAHATVPDATAAASPLEAILRHHPIRGPPAFLA